MISQDAINFLIAAAQNTALREKFNVAANPEQFIKIASELGYTFTTKMLLAVVKEHSNGVTSRRQTGIWPWLRSVRWIDQTVQKEMLFQNNSITKTELDLALSEMYSNNKKLIQLMIKNNVVTQEKVDQFFGKQQVMLGQLLIEEKLIFQPELEQALKEQRCTSKKLGEIMIEKNIISPKQLEIILNKQYWQNNGFWVIS